MTCGKELGIFSLKHNHKIGDNKIETWCHNCHVNQEKELREEKYHKINELQKAEVKLKLEKKFVEKIIQAINRCDSCFISFKRELKKPGVEIRDYKSEDGIFTINVLGNYTYHRYDHRYTTENMMKQKRFGFKSCLGNIIVQLSKEKQTYEYKEIIVVFWGEEYDMYGHGRLVRYASFKLVPSTLKKMVLENLYDSQVIQVFDYHIGDFPNGLG
ncbi:hypothetical protein RSJ42_08275 [Methanosarcina hadiensis]|uniref:hypothetical protein n=1 Tax=Methanosarcina hadiensis TaxID=3078083 RepID=UPI003977BE2C